MLFFKGNKKMRILCWSKEGFILHWVVTITFLLIIDKPVVMTVRTGFLKREIHDFSFYVMAAFFFSSFCRLREKKMR